MKEFLTLTASNEQNNNDNLNKNENPVKKQIKTDLYAILPREQKNIKRRQNPGEISQSTFSQ